jgi:hypothetical protein
VTDLFMALDQTQPPGERLAPEVRAEIAVIAPSVVSIGSVTTAKLHDDAVTYDKLGPAAVHTDNLQDDAVTAAKLADNAVLAASIADGAVGLTEAGGGLLKATDKTGTARSLTMSGPYTAAEYGAIGSPDPNTVYVIV